MPVLVKNITPDKISGLNLWLKAESLASYSNGANITSWNDSSGNGYNFTGSINLPTCAANFINGGQGLTYNAALFSNSSLTYLTANNTSCGNFYNNFTIFQVVYQTSTSTSGNVTIAKGSANYQMSGWYIDTNFLGLNTSGNISSIRAGWVPAAKPLSTLANTWSIYSWIVQSNGSGQGWKNGVPGTSTSSFTATSNANYLSLGNYGYTVNYNFGGYIAEVIIYNIALSTTQRQDIENYLRFKFQI